MQVAALPSYSLLPLDPVSHVNSSVELEQAWFRPSAPWRFHDGLVPVLACAEDLCIHVCSLKTSEYRHDIYSFREAKCKQLQHNLSPLTTHVREPSHLDTCACARVRVHLRQCQHRWATRITGCPVELQW
jgi:hypothetical protein